jgi:phosphatidylglycerophosphatase C
VTGPAGAVVAAFDVDGTLTRSDCVGPFLRRLGGLRSIAVAIARRPGASVASAARRDRDALKEVVVGGVYRGRAVDDVVAVGHEFARHVEREMLRDDVVARLRWHRDEGHRTVLVSASLRAYLDPLARALGVDGVVCTDVLAVDGRYTDRLLAGNCRGPVKAERLRAWLAGNGLADARLWAYGDSSGDRELLAMAHHPHLVKGTTLAAVPEESVR